MPRLPEHLQRLDGAYKFRMRVPAALQPAIGKREFRRFFGKVDLAEAKRRLSIARLEAFAELDKARRMSAQTARTKHVSGTQNGFDDADLWSLMSVWFIEKRREDAAEIITVDRAELLLEDIAHLEDPRDNSNSSNLIRQSTVRFLEGQGLFIAEESAEFRQLFRLIQDAFLERNKRRVQEVVGHAGLELDPRFSGLDAQTILQPIANLTLASLITSFMADKAKQNVNERTRKKQYARLNLFQEILGPIRLKSIDRAKARQLFDDISRLPANLHKRFRNKSVKEVLDLPSSLRGPPIQPTTANDYMGAFWALMEFAVNEHLIERNPAGGLRVASDRTSGKEKRDPFTIEELVRIFNAPLYRGCVNDKALYARKGANRPRRARFWIALIALFSGMRQNEICPLLVTDVKYVGSVPVFEVQWDDDSEDDLLPDAVRKSVKTAAGLRVVPVHPELIRLGFLEYVQAAKANTPRGRLFPDLTLSKTGSYSANYSKWYANFLDHVEITDKKKNFHSFRHTFRDAARLTNMSLERLRLLCGWKNSGIDARYGGSKEVEAAILSEEIGKIQYPGLNLDHLLPY